MLQPSLCGAWLLVVGLGAVVADQPAAPPQAQDSRRVGELIERLGSSKFQERNAAQKELEAVGVPALEALKKSLTSADLETRKRAGDLIRRIEEKALTSRLLAPKRVRLKITDMPALEAVSELARLSGYPIQVLGDRTKLANKKVTLDTGDVSFWEALDQLCGAAGLAELVQAPHAPVVNVNDLLPQGILPPPVLPVPPRPQPRPAPEVKTGPVKADDLEARAKVARAQLAEVAAALAQAQLARLPGAPPPPPRPPAIQFQIQNGVVGQAILGPSPPSLAYPGITLVPGVPKNQHVSYAGAVRARVYSLPAAKAGEYQLSLEASAEPALQGFTIVGAPTLEKAVDEHGETLSLAPELAQQNVAPPRVLAPARILLREMGAVNVPVQRQLALHLKSGAKPSRTLKDLSGTFTAQVLAPPEALITLNNVLKSSGESAQGKSGGLLKLNSIDKLPSGNYKVQVHLENPPGALSAPGMILGNGVIQMQQIQIIQMQQLGVIGGTASLPSTQALPELLDAAGHKFQLVQIPARRMNVNNGAVTQELTIIYRGPDGTGGPDRLIVHGSRAVTVTIPFTFQNVMLK